LLGVREDCRWVATNATQVRIDPEALAALAEEILRGDIPAAPAWDTSIHWTCPDPDRVANYVLVLDALNFCFWGDPKWKISYQGRVLDGYFAEAAALKRAIEDGFDLTDARVMAGATLDDLRQVFRGEGEIPWLGKRVDHLREAGEVLLRSFGGQFSTYLREASEPAVRTVQRLVECFPSFDDVATYRGRRIQLYKRAQILIVDLMAALPDQPWTRFAGLEDLTAFADYKVPQVLREKGVLAYSEPLAGQVDALVEIPAGSEPEVELRAATVVAVADLAAAVGLREVDLDGRIWHLGQTMAFRHPYHRTRTVFY